MYEYWKDRYVDERVKYECIILHLDTIISTVSIDEVQHFQFFLIQIYLVALFSA